MDGDSNTQKTSNPIPCANQCGFFGNPLTENLCSKCFRDIKPKKDNSDNNNNNNNNSILNNNTVKKEIEKQTNNTVVVETNNNKIVEDASTEGDKEPEETKKVQTDTSKCFSCNKKVGLLGFKCRCSYTYCSAHRYSNKHDCDFDYKALQKEKLAVDNPLVMASKINKI